MQIQKTKDYNLFKINRLNRTIGRKYVKELERSISEDNQLEVNPIIVDEDMVIVDGQHRLQAAKNLGVPVYYVVTPTSSMRTVKLLNSNVHVWRMGDYLESFVRANNPDYLVLKRFVDKYNLAISDALTLFNENLKNTHAARAGFKQGDFKATNLKKATEVAEVVRFIRTNVPTDAQHHKSLVDAVVLMYKTKGFNMEHLVAKVEEMKKTGERAFVFGAAANLRGYLRQFEEVYNFNMKTNQIRFF